MFKKFLVVATLAAGLISTQASADFVATDWKTNGDKAAVLDTSTGLEWLKFRYTDGKSIDQVKGLLDSSLSGWRFSTADEVATLLNTALPASFSPGVTGSASLSGPEASAFASLFGVTKDYGTDAFSRGLIYLEDEQKAGYAGVWFNKDIRYQNYSVNYLSSKYATSYKHDNFAVFLVSDGGTTLSSINNPMLNVNNPEAPINTPEVSDVPAPLGGLAAVFLLFLLRRRD